MHFCVSAARGGLNGHFCLPRKMGTNWFMPAFVKRRFGESGSRLDEGTMVCCFDLKKSRNDWRIWRLVICNGGRLARRNPDRTDKPQRSGSYHLSRTLKRDNISNPTSAMALAVSLKR